ncbi:MAG: hypothetical protein K0R09_527 [Clostridiales bacterium]|jgi:uncharacterized protein YggE|nr:hypothetical protein [Clostridiales bacterium]
MGYLKGQWFDEENSPYYSEAYRNEEDLCKCENRINLNGKGSVKAIPDIAIVILGVVTEGKDLNAVQKENADIMERVIFSLSKLGIDDRDIETESYVVEPMYDHVEGKQIFRGYKVRNMLRVTVREIGKTGRIIDSAVKSGANTVSSIDFDISEQGGYYYQALKLAVEDSVRKAEVVSKTMGVNVDRIPVIVTEESYGPIPMVLGAFAESKIAATPIRPKGIEITASVKSVFKYYDE